jgi:hypothetical protein
MLLHMLQENYEALQQHQAAVSPTAVSADSQRADTDSFPSLIMLRKWCQYYTPAELTSVNVDCSIFNPGRNWPGNIKQVN